MEVEKPGEDDDTGEQWSSSASRQACEQKVVPLVCRSQDRQKSAKQSMVDDVKGWRWEGRPRGICRSRGWRTDGGLVVSRGG